MAKLTARGRTVVGIVELLGKRDAVCSDGVVLRNYGDGWTVYGRVKPDKTPEEALRVLQSGVDRGGPAYHEYRRLLFGAVGKCLKARVALHTFVSHMPGDPDGVWSDCQDLAGEHLDLDECVALCRAYQAMQAETRERGLTVQSPGGEV